MSDAPRIAPVQSLSPKLAELFVQLGREVEGPPNAIATLAHQPAVAQGLLAAIQSCTFGLPARDREIVLLRSAWRAGCAYMFARHVVHARQAGASDNEIEALTREESGWEPRERALIALADELSDGAKVSDETWAELRTHYSDAEMIQLIVHAGLYRTLAGVLNSAQVQLDDGFATMPGFSAFRA